MVVKALKFYVKEKALTLPEHSLRLTINLIKNKILIYKNPMLSIETDQLVVHLYSIIFEFIYYKQYCWNSNLETFFIYFQLINSVHKFFFC